MKKIQKVVAGLAVVMMAISAAVFIPNGSVSAVTDPGSGGGGGSGSQQQQGQQQGQQQQQSGSNPVSAAQSGFDQVNGKVNANTDLYGTIGVILNIVYSIIGIIAVVMVILGGISYATSQGDPGKVKKGKDTILYGIIGLVIVIMAFAITQFVLTAIGG